MYSLFDAWCGCHAQATPAWHVRYQQEASLSESSEHHWESRWSHKTV